MKKLSVTELQQLHASGIEIKLIDVRSPGEFAARHLPFAHNLPLDQITAETIARHATKETPVYLICQTGGRSARAASTLDGYGYTETYSIDGGTHGWSRAGFPTNEGKQAVSIERQVRIAAGSLGAIGSALAYFVHPGFIAIPAFVGTGLAIAGITDTCAMGLALMKMPWNR